VGRDGTFYGKKERCVQGGICDKKKKEGSTGKPQRGASEHKALEGGHKSLSKVRRKQIERRREREYLKGGGRVERERSDKPSFKRP